MTTATARPFQSEKTNVLGELAVRFRRASVSDEEVSSYPPPPPVFQTYARQLAGDTEEVAEATSSPNKYPNTVNKTNHLNNIKTNLNNNNNKSSKTSIKISPEAEAGGRGLVSLSGPQPLPGPGVTTLPTKYVHKKCSACHQPVITGGGYANGRLYHQDCFKCYNCGCQLENKFSSAQGNFFCGLCFKLYQKTCSVCQCAITKDCVEGNGKFYHSNCIKCVDCKMVLDGCYYVFMGNFFCEKDYNNKKKKCADCGKQIDGLYYTDTNNRTLCHQDYKKQLGKCKRCGDYLEGDILKIPGASFHAKCFNCKVCHVALSGDVMTDDDRELYCNKCYDNQFAERCFSCKQPIVAGARLRALGRDYHPECFRCESCGLILEDGCYPANNKPYCMDCFEMLS